LDERLLLSGCPEEGGFFFVVALIGSFSGVFYSKPALLPTQECWRAER
jgi:hypothetical protein